MSKIRFKDKQVLDLSKNMYIKNISNKSITYTNEFKIHFIAEYNNGKTPKGIFTNSGFDIDVIGVKCIECTSFRWRKSYEKYVFLGLDDSRFNNSRRSRKRE